MKLTSDYNLGKLYPHITSEWHPTKNGQITPFVITPGSHKKVWWKCKLGHEWEAVVENRTYGSGCPYCSRRKVGEDNNLAIEYSLLVEEWHQIKNENLKPTDVTSGSGKKVWWKCSQGYEWKAKVGSRTRGHGCPKCYLERKRSK